jgi:hypothetical protein
MTHEAHVAAVPAGTEDGTAGKGPLDPQGGISAPAAPPDGWLPIATAPPVTDAPQPRPCWTCKHCTSKSRGEQLSRCTRFYSPVINDWSFCQVERLENQPCGPSGALWEPRLTLWQKIKDWFHVSLS